MSQFTRRQFATAAAAAALNRHSLGSQTDKKSVTRPNIILLLTDDQRWNTLGCMGNPVIQTPALDRLARAGCLFKNNFVTTSICAPSRVSILTGLYSRCHGIHEFDTGLTGEKLDASYPMALRRAGYRTGFIGKYGAAGGGVASGDFSRLPTNSFDYFKGFPGQGTYFPDRDNPKRHLTRIMGDQAIEFLEGCSSSQPFCLSISFKAPHVQGLGQWFNDPDHDSLYENAKIHPPEHTAKKYFDALPPFLKQDYAGRTRWESYIKGMAYDDIVKKYYRLITGVDAQVGRILDELSKRGLEKNTVILFTSDNGYLLGDRGLVDKYVMYEESIRTPLIIMDPRLPGNRATVREEMTLNIDLAPTILDLAGVPGAERMNGRSLTPLLKRGKRPWRGEWFYEHLFELRRPEDFPKSEGIRTARWKYTRWIEQKPVYEQLFDLRADPGELRNLAHSEAHRKQCELLRTRCDVWKRGLEKWDRTTAWHDPA